MLRRRTSASANLLELDAQGRIKLPASLLEYASIVRDVTIVGVQDRIELWDRTRWAQYLKQIEEEGDAVADELATP
jgi:MraZ protein